MLYTLPPQNIEAEASLFSAILIDNRILNEILEILHPLDFYKTAHQIMFAAIVDLYQKKDPVDLISLAYLPALNKPITKQGDVWVSRATPLLS